METPKLAFISFEIACEPEVISPLLHPSRSSSISLCCCLLIFCNRNRRSCICKRDVGVAPLIASIKLTKYLQCARVVEDAPQRISVAEDGPRDVGPQLFTEPFPEYVECACVEAFVDDRVEALLAAQFIPDVDGLITLRRVVTASGLIPHLVVRQKPKVPGLPKQANLHRRLRSNIRIPLARLDGSSSVRSRVANRSCPWRSLLTSSRQ